MIISIINVQVHLYINDGSHREGGDNHENS